MSRCGLGKVEDAVCHVFIIMARKEVSSRRRQPGEWLFATDLFLRPEQTTAVRKESLPPFSTPQLINTKGKKQMLTEEYISVTNTSRYIHNSTHFTISSDMAWLISSHTRFIDRGRPIFAKCLFAFLQTRPRVSSLVTATVKRRTSAVYLCSVWRGCWLSQVVSTF